MAIEVLYVDPGGSGYHPVFYMARLAAELLEAKLVTLRSRPLSLSEKASALLPRKRGDLAGILICPAPYDVTAVMLQNDWRKRYGQMAVWVFD